MHKFFSLNILHRYVLILCALVSGIFLDAAAAGVHLFNSDHDLSSTLINKLFMDSDGFLWVATESGLNRYDGTKMIIYKKIRNDNTSLAHDFVNDVFEDSQGNIFVCTHSGLQQYNKLTDRFDKSAVRADGTPYTNSVKTMLELPDHRLIALGNTVKEVVVEMDKIIVKDLPFSDKISNVDAAIADKKGNIWIGQEQKGIIRVGKDNSTKIYLSDDPDIRITDFVESKNGTIYASSTKGRIYKYNPSSDRFEQIGGNTLENIIIKDMAVSDNGDLIIATDGYGMHVIKSGSDTIERMNVPYWNDRKLKVHTMIRDKYDNIWLGLYQKGVLMMPGRDSGFNSIDQSSGKNAYIGSACVTSILREPDGRLWIGTDNDYIYSLSPDFKESTHYTNNVPKVIMNLFRDSKGNIWVGTYANGTGIIKSDGSFTEIPLFKDDGSKVQHVFGFTETPDGKIWIATMGDGLICYDPASRSAKSMTEVNENVNKWISDILYSQIDKRLYLATYDGLYKVDPVTLQTDFLTRGLITTSIFEDKDTHNFWIATPSGLALSENGNNVSKIFTTDDGLPSNTVYAIEKSGNSLWVSTNNGLSQFNLDNGTFTSYYVNEGLQSNEFFKKSSFADAYGNLYFGGINGLSYFKPENITTPGSKPEVRIVDFYIGGTSVRNGYLSGGRAVIDEPIYNASAFHLDRVDNSFTIEFTTKQLVESSLIDYYYSFDGDEWEKLPKAKSFHGLSYGNMLTFSNVKSGKHTLRIKAVDNGLESDILSVDIYVSHPWYATWWAYLIYLALASLIVWIITRHFKQRAQRIKKETELRHENDIREAKLQFFTNISHEIRTPLTLVLSPIQKLLKEDEDPYRKRLYRTIQRNSQRIHKLVNEIMDIRKIDNKQMKLKYQEVDITGFVDDLYNTFEPAAIEKGVDLTFEHQGCDSLMAWVDPGNFDKIVMNLLSNAIKFTPKGGSVKINLSTGSNGISNSPLYDYFQITVTDTGIGIDKEDHKRIFDRFYQSNNNKIGGTGIGLHLTHSLVIMHHGEISISDNPEGKGSCFTVRLPIGNKHLSTEEIDPSANEVNIEKDILEMNSMAADQSVTPEPETNQAPSSRKLVYIVDDDNEVRNYLAQTMSEKFHIEAFSNGVEALDAMHRNIPDLIITDVMMPEMDGITLAQKIRQNVNFNHVPLIMLSAKNREEDTIEGLDTGADAYITKPFNVDILIRTARNLIEKHQMLRNVYSGNQDQMDKVDDIKVLSSDEKLLERIMKVVNKNIGNPNITVEMIAQEIGISRVHLHRKLKELTNQSTRDFIRNIRLQQAAKMLRDKKLSVAEVSDLVGFKHPNNFSTNFKEMFGKSPSAYAEQYHPTNTEQ